MRIPAADLTSMRCPSKRQRSRRLQPAARGLPGRRVGSCSHPPLKEDGAVLPSGLGVPRGGGLGQRQSRGHPRAKLPSRRKMLCLWRLGLHSLREEGAPGLFLSSFGWHGSGSRRRRGGFTGRVPLIALQLSAVTVAGSGHPWGPSWCLWQPAAPCGCLSRCWAGSPAG